MEGSYELLELTFLAFGAFFGLTALLIWMGHRVSSPRRPTDHYQHDILAVSQGKTGKRRRPQRAKIPPGRSRRSSPIQAGDVRAERQSASALAASDSQS